MNLNFDDRIKEVSFEYQEIKELMEKYSDYKKVTTKEMVFREPVTEDEIECAKGCKKRTVGFMAIFVAIYFLIVIPMIFFAKWDVSSELEKIFLSCLISMPGVVATVFLILNLIRKPQIMIGKGIYKQHTGRKSQKTYYVTLVTDIPEKLLFSRVQFGTVDDYYSFNQEEDVLIVNTLPVKAFAWNGKRNLEE